MLIRRNQWKCFSHSLPSPFRAVPIIFLVQIKVSWWCVNYLSWVILNTIYLDRTGICFFGFQTSCLVHCPFKWCVSEVVLFALLLFGFSFSATVQKVLCSPVKWTFSTAQKKMLLHILDVQSSVDPLGVLHWRSTGPRQHLYCWGGGSQAYASWYPSSEAWCSIYEPDLLRVYVGGMKASLETAHLSF